jgi:hypothetical protein
LDAVSGAFQPTHIDPTPCCAEMGALPMVPDAIDPSPGCATHSGLLQERLPMGADDSVNLGALVKKVNIIGISLLGVN